MTWSRRFDAPIPLASGQTLVTLRQAGEYIASLSLKPSNRSLAGEPLQAAFLWLLSGVESS